MNSTPAGRSSTSCLKWENFTFGAFRVDLYDSRGQRHLHHFLMQRTRLHEKDSLDSSFLKCPCCRCSLDDRDITLGFLHDWKYFTRFALNAGKFIQLKILFELLEDGRGWSEAVDFATRIVLGYQKWKNNQCLPQYLQMSVH